MRRSSLLLAAAVELGVAAATVIAPAGPAVATDDLAEVQQAHLAVIDEIATWDASTPHPRLGTVEGDPLAGTIDISWAGFVPTEVRGMADAAAQQGIDVTFVPRESSEQELLEIAYGIAASMPSDGAFAIALNADELAVEVPTEQAAQRLGATVTVEETDSAPVNATNTQLRTGTAPMTTAAHCSDYDARTLPRIYTNETETITVTGSQNTWPPAGYRLCSSGQVTGWKCDLTSGEAYVTSYGTSRGPQCMHVQIVRSSGDAAFCLGDSGGPIVTLPTARGATAVGVVSGIKSRVSVRCSPEGLIAPISQVMSTVPGLQLRALNRP